MTDMTSHPAVPHPAIGDTCSPGAPHRARRTGAPDRDGAGRVGTVRVLLAVLLVLPTLAGAQDRIAVVGDSLSDARDRYAAATDVARDDCDPVDGGRWVCASFDNPTLADLAGPADRPVPPARTVDLVKPVGPVGPVGPVEPVEPVAPAPVDEPSATVGAWPTPGGRPNVQRVPRSLHAWHKTNLFASSNLVTYRDGRRDALTQAFLFLDDGLRWHVTTRDFPTGAWSQPLDVHDAVSGRPQERDSHNNGFIGITAAGTIFAGANHHVDPASVARSSRPWDWTSLASYPRSRFPAGTTDRWTYPSTYTLDGVLHISVREQETNRGPEFRWLSFAYDEQADRWSVSPDWNSGIALREYATNVAVDAAGETAHVFSIWRDESNGDTGAHLHRGLFHKRTRDNRTWYGMGRAEPLSLPQWLDIGGGDRGSPVPDYIVEPSPDWIPNGAGVAAVDAAGRPHTITRRRDAGRGAYWSHWDEQRWRTYRLPWSDGQSYSVVAIGETVYGLMLGRDGDVYAGRLDPAHPTYKQPRRIITGVHNSASEITIDHEAARLGYLSVVGQETLNKGWNDGGDAGSPGNIVTVPLSLIARDDTGVIVSR